MSRFILTFILFTFSVTLSLAKPKLLGSTLTSGIIKNNIGSYTLKRGNIDRYDSSSPFIDGVITFSDGDTSYEIKTDSRGRVTEESQSMQPASFDQMTSLINYYKGEGRITEDQTALSQRRVSLYLRYTENVVISSDITARWDENSLGRKWNCRLSVSYILTSRY